MIKKYIATDKHPALKEGTTMVVRDNGSVNINWMIAEAPILAMWIRDEWVKEVQSAKWNDSELKEMCIAYATHAVYKVKSKEPSGTCDAIAEAFDDWFEDRTAIDSFEVRS